MTSSLKKTSPRIGAHVSAAGGLKNCIANAENIGATCIQIFGASPRQWNTSMPSEEDVRAYHETLKKSIVEAIYLHAPYLVNLATLDKEMLKKSVALLTAHLKIADSIGARGVIFHIGSGKGRQKEFMTAHVVEAMKEILSSVHGDTQLIIENCAGGGDRIGVTAKEIGDIIRKIGSPRVTVCIDTAHAFEAGIIDEYSAEKIHALFDEFDKEIGIDRVVALHVNDSKTAFNSHHDRHENIGEGYIGLEGFKNLAREPLVQHMDWILEVPGFDDTGPDKKNVDILKKLFSSL
ncbi:deoxyribonuclease IV [Candidatus Uhrbacteria bacterium]|nr:deoxyribonuclease IV [Candidatus Uhrbacteria bacterium]